MVSTLAANSPFGGWTPCSRLAHAFARMRMSTTHNTMLAQEREGIAEQMERVEAMMKGLGLAAATNVP